MRIADPASGEPIDGWRQAVRVSVRADPIPPERVDGDEEDVRPTQGAWAGERAIRGTAAARRSDDGEHAARAPHLRPCDHETILPELRAICLFFAITPAT